MCKNCYSNQSEHEKGTSSSFIFGLILGLVAAAIIAVVIYKYRKSDVIASLQSKLNDLTHGLFDQTKLATSTPKPSPRSKIKKTKQLENISTDLFPVDSKTIVKSSKPKMFKVPRK